MNVTRVTIIAGVLTLSVKLPSSSHKFAFLRHASVLGTRKTEKNQLVQ